MKNPMSFTRWIFWAVCCALLLAASFVCGFTWGFPDSAWHQAGAAAGCAVVALMLVGLVAQVAADWRTIREREESELRREVERNAARAAEGIREGLRER